jgi:H+-transporting ATPase
VIGTGLTFAGLPDFHPLPWWQTSTILGYAMVSCLGVNDAVKVAMIRWRMGDPGGPVR